MPWIYQPSVLMAVGLGFFILDRLSQPRNSKIDSTFDILRPHGANSSSSHRLGSELRYCWQERLVSPRVIHFSDREIFWDFLTISARESNSKVYTQRGQSTEWEDENFRHSTNEMRYSWIAGTKWYLNTQAFSWHTKPTYPSDFGHR